MTEENKLVAKVDDVEIHQDQVMEFVRGMDPNLSQQFRSEEGVKQVIQELINQELLLMDAKKKGLDKDQEFQDALEKTKDNLLKSYAFSKTIDGVKATEEDGKEYYEKYKEHFVVPESVTASHILVDEEEKAKDLKKQLDEGASFEDLAKEHSTCPSKEAGGNLGTFTPGQMVEPFDKKVFSMEVGEISDPVKTEFGYHLIQLNDKNEGGEKPYEEVKEQCLREALRLKQQKAYLDRISELEKDHEITLY